MDFFCRTLWGKFVIRVTLQPEPIGFDANVRKPGMKFLAINHAPSIKDFKNYTYWKWAAADLHAAYRGICAYTCFYLPPPGTIDHFFPKSRRPNLAYEWSNLRLASHRVNGYKADRMDIVDPCDVEPGWFIMDIPSCLVRPGPGIANQVAEQVENTIRILRLNDDDAFVQERCNLMLEYAEGNVSLDFISRRYPFLAVEITRQGIVHTANTLFKRPGA